MFLSNVKGGIIVNPHHCLPSTKCFNSRKVATSIIQEAASVTKTENRRRPSATPYNYSTPIALWV